MNTFYDTKLSEYSPNKDLHFLLGHSILHFPPACFEEVAIVNSLAEAYIRSYGHIKKYKSYKFRKKTTP